MVENAISHPVSIFFFPPEMSEAAMVAAEKLHFPASLAVENGQCDVRRSWVQFQESSLKRELSYLERRHPFVLPSLPLPSCLKCRHDGWSRSSYLGILGPFEVGSQ